jgi:ferric-dicitrate binding protein FerR (iron transport regulator)
VSDDFEANAEAAPSPAASADTFGGELAADERFERRLFWRQLAIVVVVAVLIVLLIVAG